MTHKTFSLSSADDLNLAGFRWEIPKPKGVICLVHGLGEHSLRYPHVAQALNQGGYAVQAIDLRGHGQSAGPRGHTPSYNALLDDITLLINDAAAYFPQTPRFLYGHSLGGNLVLNYALRRDADLKGVIATDPWLQLAFEPPAIKTLLGKTMDKIFPAFIQPSGLDTKALSHDPEVVRAYEQDPLVHDRISARLFMSAYMAGYWALENASGLHFPTLLMHGTGDQLTSPAASQKFAERAGEICTLRLWENFYHEIHNEPQKQDVFNAILDWLNRL